MKENLRYILTSKKRFIIDNSYSKNLLKIQFKKF